jgi:hypothetical protein
MAMPPATIQHPNRLAGLAIPRHSVWPHRPIWEILGMHDESTVSANRLFLDPNDIKALEKREFGFPNFFQTFPWPDRQISMG